MARKKTQVNATMVVGETRVLAGSAGPLAPNERSLNFGERWPYAPAAEQSDYIKIKSRYQLFIDGKFRAPHSGAHFDSINPATEEKLAEIWAGRDVRRRSAALDRYVKNSRPKTGWDGQKNVNHFELIQHIYRDEPLLRGVLMDLCRPQLLAAVAHILGSEFAGMISPIRREMILACLARRLERYCEIVT